MQHTLKGIVKKLNRTKDNFIKNLRSSVMRGGALQNVNVSPGSCDVQQFAVFLSNINNVTVA